MPDEEAEPPVCPRCWRVDAAFAIGLVAGSSLVFVTLWMMMEPLK